MNPDEQKMVALTSRVDNLESTLNDHSRLSSEQHQKFMEMGEKVTRVEETSKHIIERVEDLKQATRSQIEDLKQTGQRQNERVEKKIDTLSGVLTELSEIKNSMQDRVKEIARAQFTANEAKDMAKDNKEVIKDQRNDHIRLEKQFNDHLTQERDRLIEEKNDQKERRAPWIDFVIDIVKFVTLAFLASLLTLMGANWFGK